MTQEWFESADLEKNHLRTKSEIQPDVARDFRNCGNSEPQASQETSVSPKELETHEEEAPEMIEETQIEERGKGKLKRSTPRKPCKSSIPRL